MDNPNNGTDAYNATAWITTAIVVIVVILGAWWLIAHNRSSAVTGSDTGTTTGATTTDTAMTGSDTNTSGTGATGASTGATTGTTGSTGSTGATTGTTGATGSTGSTGSTATTGGSNPTTTANGDAVSAANQPAGSTVTISSVTLAKTGWVAIMSPEKRVLGAAWFVAGTHTNVPVYLLKPTTKGATYQVLLYVDNGNKVFELHTDTMINGASGSFTAQ